MISPSPKVSFLTKKAFYYLKPLIPRRLQLFLRRSIITNKRCKYSDVWPIDSSAGDKPAGWNGWPEGKQFALVLIHDVDTQKGHDACRQLIEIEKKMGVRSSFFFVPERYCVSDKLRDWISAQGFSVGVHGLNHDGSLFSSWNEFKKQSVKINKYLKDWGARGFSSPSMHHNLAWTPELKIDYDISTFDTDPFEPQPDGVKTIFPFVVEDASTGRAFVELPYTLPQDFTLYVLMKEKDITIWKSKLDWIAEKGGMALVNSHPDYMNFGNGKLGAEEYPSTFYRDFLEYLKNRYKDRYWHVLPNQITEFAKANLGNCSSSPPR